MSLTKLTYAGHSAVLFEGTQGVIAIDPWLEGNPRCPSSLINPARLDLIVLTHGHADHAGDTVRLAKKYGARVAATYELAMLLVGEGVPQQNVVPMNKGGSVTIDGIRITLTHALHSSSYDTANGPVYAGEACGVVLSDDKVCVYHAGDTAFFSDMRLIGESHHPHLALPPCGDRFTMNQQEAATAAQLVGCRHAIPIHYKTFPILEQNADVFSSACKAHKIQTHALEPGEALVLSSVLA